MSAPLETLDKVQTEVIDIAFKFGPKVLVALAILIITNTIHINATSHKRSTHSCSALPCCTSQMLPSVPIRIRTTLDQRPNNFNRVSASNRVIDTPPPTPQRPIQINVSTSNSSSNDRSRSARRSAAR